jgi:diguanylate cyclase (GGDEF)-like protein/PAS domain S-box-containing protein
MASPIWKTALESEATPGEGEYSPSPSEPAVLNLPANAGSAQQREVLDALPVLVFLESAGQVVYANTEARQILGETEGEWAPRPIEDVLWGLFPGTAEPRTHLVRTENSSPFHATVPSTDGRLLQVEGTYSILNTEPREAIVVAHASGRDRAPRSRLMEDVLASVPEAVAITHGSHLLYTNPAFTELFGYTAEEASGAELRALIVPETRGHEVAMLEKQIDRLGRIALETVRICKNGDLVDVALVAGPLRVDGVNVGYVLSFRDIGERKQLETQLQHDALYDLSTSLPNRALFLDRLTMALSRSSRRLDQSCGVLLMDLDRFKEIAETLGHAAGQALLRAVADRLRAALRPQDSASRIGADQFAVLVENILEEGDVEIVANRILHEMARPFEIFGHLIRVSVSMGVAISGPEHLAAGMLMRDADFALYRARSEGGGGFEIFDRNLEFLPRVSREPELELRRILDRRTFEVWFQPIYRLASGKLEGFESILRWRRPDGQVESFHDLLSVAEATGLSLTLGRESLNIACQQLHVWSDAMPQQRLNVTLNITHRQFYHPDLSSQIEKVLAATQVDPSCLVFEVAETTLNENLPLAVEILARLARFKVRLAVDNFGDSLAPLDHLLSLPIDMVKMSPQLTAAAASEGRPQAVLASLVHLGHALGVEVVAQGIESQAQLDTLVEIGCELGQGHLFSHALEPGRAVTLAAIGYWALPRRA